MKTNHDLPPNEALNKAAVSGITGYERIICAAVWYKEIPIKNTHNNLYKNILESIKEAYELGKNLKDIK